MIPLVARVRPLSKKVGTLVFQRPIKLGAQEDVSADWDRDFKDLRSPDFLKLYIGLGFLQ